MLLPRVSIVDDAWNESDTVAYLDKTVRSILVITFFIFAYAGSFYVRDPPSAVPTKTARGKTGSDTERPDRRLEPALGCPTGIGTAVRAQIRHPSDSAACDKSLRSANFAALVSRLLTIGLATGSSGHLYQAHESLRIIGPEVVCTL